MNTTATNRIQENIDQETRNLEMANAIGKAAPHTEIKIHIYTWARNATLTEIEALIADETAELNHLITTATAREISEQSILVQALRTAHTIKTYAI